MKNKITRCLAALGLVGGILAMSISPAAATPSPPLNTLTVTRELNGPDVVGYPSDSCIAYFQHGNSGGVAYAMMARAYQFSCSPGDPGRSCGNIPFDSIGIPYSPPPICRKMVRVAYQMPNGSTGASYQWLGAGPNDMNPSYAVGPQGSTILSSQIYAVAYTQAMCNCDPLVVDADPTYGVLVTIVAYYTGV